jgi:hypothetical protein
MRLSPRHRSLVFALALALWFASTLGLVHRTLHSPGAAPGVVASLGFASIAQDHATAAPIAQVVEGISSHGLAALFGHHSDAECRLYDQLSHGSSVPCVPLVVLPLLLPAATFAYLEGEALARWVLLLRARGPPFTR